jgi:acyl-CoA synthetase (AMP-forming)/AMP-acid ligase II
MSEAGMWGTEVARGDGPVPFLVYQQRRRRVTELLDDADTEMARLLPAETRAGTGPAVVPVADIRAAQSTPPLSIPEYPTGGEDDPALIIFTAGTTGLAKAAVLAHRSVIANLQNLLVVSKRLPHQLRGDRPPEVILQSGPVFHIGGVQSLLLAMLGGNTMGSSRGGSTRARCSISSSVSG